MRPIRDAPRASPVPRAVVPTRAFGLAGINVLHAPIPASGALPTSVFHCLPRFPLIVEILRP
jgi:hypothetical protein